MTLDNYLTNSRPLLLLMAAVLIACSQSMAQHYNLQSFNPTADGKTDDTRAFMDLFEKAGQSNQGTITIPPGKYYLSGEEAIALPSGAQVFAYGARFFIFQKSWAIKPESSSSKDRI